MDILKNLSNVIDYIEENLDGEISMERIAELALCSEYHFRRMFPYITDITISDYIRKRRLSQAAMDISNTDESIIDIALKYGYDSRISFSRAFKNHHGVTPSDARQVGQTLKLYPPLVFRIVQNGGNVMNYRIENLPDFKLFGVARKIEPFENKHIVLPKYAEEVMENGSHDETNRIIGRSTGSPLHGIHFYSKDDSSYYMFGWEYDPAYNIGDMALVDVEAGRWVVFTGPISYENQNGFHETWKNIYSQWFPNSIYEQAKNPSIEKFFDESFEIWIPIKEK